MEIKPKFINADDLVAELKDDLEQDYNHYKYWFQKEERDSKYIFAIDRIEEAPSVDVVPVDEIKLHHILIDKDGIPEVKLQFGERILILRRENDPLDVMEVKCGWWIHTAIMDDDWGCTFHKWTCSNCDYSTGSNPTGYNYCPDCGSKMKGDQK